MFGLHDTNCQQSFVPIVEKAPVNIPEWKPSKSILNHIIDSLSYPHFYNLLFSFTETNLIRSQQHNFEATTDSVNAIIKSINVNDQGSFRNGLEKIISIFLSRNEEGLKAILDSELKNAVIDWFKIEMEHINKAYVLDLIGLCLNKIILEDNKIVELIIKLMTSGMNTTGTLAKKHLLIINYLLMKLLKFDNNNNEPILKYNFMQNVAVSSSFNNPINFQFLLNGEIPNSYKVGETILNNHIYNKDMIDYITTGKFNSETKNEVIRSLFIGVSSILSNYIKYLTNLCQKSTRTLYPNASIDLCFTLPNDSIQIQGIQSADSANERDIIFFAIMEQLYLFVKAFDKSNIMDSEIFKYLLFMNNNNNIAVFCFQSFTTDLKQVLTPNFIPELFAVNIPEESSFKIIPVSFAIALHLTADIISYSPTKIQQYISDKQIRNIHTQSEATKNEIIIKEAAYALSKYLRWIPKSKPNPKLTGFIYTNLEEFEMFEKYNCECRTDVISVVSDQKNLENMKEHCAKLQIKVFT